MNAISVKQRSDDKLGLCVPDYEVADKIIAKGIHDSRKEPMNGQDLFLTPFGGFYLVDRLTLMSILVC